MQDGGSVRWMEGSVKLMEYEMEGVQHGWN